MSLATGGRRSRAFQIYPDPALYDPRTRSLFAYHRHGRMTGWPTEAGHFHAVRVLRVRPRIERAALVGISMSRRGWPQALFTVNLWTWKDRPQRAYQLKDHVRRFRIGPGLNPALLGRFANLMFRAYGPEIERLQDDKLRLLATLQRRRPSVDVRADQNVDLLNRCVIDVRARATGRPEHAVSVRTSRENSSPPSARLAPSDGRRSGRVLDRTGNRRRTRTG
jgi:hypothetical protein